MYYGTHVIPDVFRATFFYLLRSSCKANPLRNSRLLKDDIPIYIVYSFILDLSINRPNAERVRSDCWQKAMKGPNFCLLEEHVFVLFVQHLADICTRFVRLCWLG